MALPLTLLLPLPSKTSSWHDDVDGVQEVHRLSIVVPPQH